jgi:hypothetical protein
VFGQTIKTVSTASCRPCSRASPRVGWRWATRQGQRQRGQRRQHPATRIERKLKDGSELFRLSGAVQGLDSTAKTFALAGNAAVTVDYSKARLLPDGAVLENGKQVSVVSANRRPPAAARPCWWPARSRSRPASCRTPATPPWAAPSATSRAWPACAVGDVVVDASTASLKDGTVAADLVNGAQASW